jgi:hypothetical protein
MRTPLPALATVAMVALGSLIFATSAAAAPITLQFAVHLDRLCDQSANCQETSIDESMTYIFDDTITGGYAFDLSNMSIHRSDFASASMAMSGPLGIPNPSGGTETSTSDAWLYVLEGRDPIGSETAQLSTSHNRQIDQLTTFGDGSTRDLLWVSQIQMFGTRRSDTGGDGFASTTAADFVRELGLNSFFFAWSNSLRTQDCIPGAFCGESVTDPRSFYATGTATLVPPPAVPEPTSMLLLATGLAGIMCKCRARSGSSA